jgi:hypothetical protein
MAARCWGLFKKPVSWLTGFSPTRGWGLGFGQKTCYLSNRFFSRQLAQMLSLQKTYKSTYRFPKRDGRQVLGFV